MTRVRNNGGIVGPIFSPNTSYQSGIWSIVEHQKYAIGNPTFWNHATLALDMLVIGGGGSGGYGRGGTAAGGGGAGGLFYKQNVPIEKNTTYTITIGAGASRAVGNGAKNNGSDTTINGTFYGYTNSTIVGVAGGAGGAPYNCIGAGTGGNAGGSGGGGSTGGAALQPTQNLVGPNIFISGNYGTAGSSLWGAGGGGANNNTGSNVGGSGRQININGTSTYYGGGGGGGGQCSAGAGGAGGGGNGGYYWNGCLPVRDGGANLGGGGGGGGSAGDVTGGAGGSGVVIFNYPNTFGLAVSSTGSPTQTYFGANVVYKFTSSGTIAF
jgi:hypothetical protein